MVRPLGEKRVFQKSFYFLALKRVKKQLLSVFCVLSSFQVIVVFETESSSGLSLLGLPVYLV